MGIFTPGYYIVFYLQLGIQNLTTPLNNYTFIFDNFNILKLMSTKVVVAMTAFVSNKYLLSLYNIVYGKFIVNVNSNGK